MKPTFLIALMLMIAAPAFAETKSTPPALSAPRVQEITDETPGWQQEANWKREGKSARTPDVSLLVQVVLRVALNVTAHTGAA